MNIKTGPKGFTLVEAAFAVALVGMAAAGVLLPFASGAAVQAQGAHSTLSAELAGDLLEQVVSRPFHDPNGTSSDYLAGPESGEIGSAGFDNVDDFDGYCEAKGQIRDALGAVINGSNYALFSRSVKCEYVYLKNESGQGKPSFIRVTVSVSFDGSETAKLIRLVSDS